MRSDTHKVLHPIAGKPMLLHLLDTVEALGAERRVVVVGKGREQVEAALAGARRGDRAPGRAEGHRPRGAAGRGRAGRVRRRRCWSFTATRRSSRAATLRADARAARRERTTPAVVVLASSPDDGKTYGRVILGEGDRIAKMVEYKDATRGGARGHGCATAGMMAAASRATCSAGSAEVGNDNAAREYYLPDVVMVAARRGPPPGGDRGRAVRDRGRQQPRRTGASGAATGSGAGARQALEQGATLIDPESVWFCGRHRAWPRLHDRAARRVRPRRDDRRRAR